MDVPGVEPGSEMPNSVRLRAYHLFESTALSWCSPVGSDDHSSTNLQMNNLGLES